jgi:hypothetical protein
MESSSEYRRFAEECRRLAQDAKTERHRKILEEMAEAWSKLAEEAEEDNQLSGVSLAGATFRPVAGRSTSVREA